jgi:hypothetical protein
LLLFYSSNSAKCFVSRNFSQCTSANFKDQVPVWLWPLSKPSYLAAYDFNPKCLIRVIFLQRLHKLLGLVSRSLLIRYLLSNPSNSRCLAALKSTNSCSEASFLSISERSSTTSFFLFSISRMVASVAWICTAVIISICR